MQGIAVLIGLLLVVGCSRQPTPGTPLPDHHVLTEPQLPPGAVLSAPSAPNTDTPRGYAFLTVPIADAPTVLITAQHLVANSSQSAATIGAIALPNSPDIESKSPAGNIAAITPDAIAPDAIRLELSPLADSTTDLWIATPSDSSSTSPNSNSCLFRAERMASRKGLIYYRLHPSPQPLDLQDLAGAPVVNAAGKVVAIHLGGAEDLDGSQFGIGNPVSRFLPHLIASLSPENSGKTAPSASAPEALAGTPLSED